MEKNVLPVNFQDDILNASMNGKRRYRMIQNTDGTVSFEDVTDYDKIGSNFGGAQINQTNTAVNASADASKIIDSLDAVAANTQPGYMAGALAVKELNTGLNKDYSGYYSSSGVWSSSVRGAYYLITRAPIAPHQFDLYSVNIIRVTISMVDGGSKVVTSFADSSTSIDKNGDIYCILTDPCPGAFGTMEYTLTRK